MMRFVNLGFVRTYDEICRFRIRENIRFVDLELVRTYDEICRFRTRENI